MAPQTRPHSRPTSSTSTTLEGKATPSSNSSSSSSFLTSSPSPQTPTIAIIGTGWAGHTLLQTLSPLFTTHKIILLSPVRTMALTPLLASAACGIFDFRIAEEPIRRITLMSSGSGNGEGAGAGARAGVQKYQVFCDSVDFERKVVRCRSAVELRLGGGGKGKGEFEVNYDKLVICPGSTGTDFGTPGVAEHTLSIRTVTDAQSLRARLLDLLEFASLPSTSEELRKQLLHIVIVGGGPTGCELAAEIDELMNEHLGKIYPGLLSFVKVSIYEVADRMLGSFGEKLGEYAMERFRRRGVEVRTGEKIKGFEEGVMSVSKGDGEENGEEEVSFGVAVWCVGNKAVPLVEGLEGVMKEKGRVGTDAYLRVLRSSDTDEGKGKGEDEDNNPAEVVEGVYALGDCADIADYSLPMTAEVAVQKAKWLGKHLSGRGYGREFQYEQKDVVAYIGKSDGVIDGTNGDWTGTAAWAAWRGGSLQWTRGWRRRVMVVVYWVLNKFDGREIARR